MHSVSISAQESLTMEGLVTALCVEVWLCLFWDCSDGSFHALIGMCCDDLMDYSDVVTRVASCLPWTCLVACLMYGSCLITPLG